MFISYDFVVVEVVSDCIVVFYFGLIVEIGIVEKVFLNLCYFYMKLLVESVFVVGCLFMVLENVEIELLDLLDLLIGCVFRVCCWYVSVECVVFILSFEGLVIY